MADVWIRPDGLLECAECGRVFKLDEVEWHWPFAIFPCKHRQGKRFHEEVELLYPFLVEKAKGVGEPITPYGTPRSQLERLRKELEPIIEEFNKKLEEERHGGKVA